jgi:transposase
LYAYKVEKLAALEKLSKEGLIDLFYGDESHVCSEGYVPYGWQFPNGKVTVLVEKGHKINCLGFISRCNEFHWATTEQNIDSIFVKEFLDDLSLKIRKETFLVLDNASIHRAKIIEQCIPYWEKRGLFIFYLPPYSPHLNLAETVWRKMKGEWIDPDDYFEKDSLFYAVNRLLANLGKNVKINFSDFNLN